MAKFDKIVKFVWNTMHSSQHVNCQETLCAPCITLCTSFSHQRVQRVDLVCILYIVSSHHVVFNEQGATHWTCIVLRKVAFWIFLWFQLFTTRFCFVTRSTHGTGWNAAFCTQRVHPDQIMCKICVRLVTQCVNRHEIITMPLYTL